MWHVTVQRRITLRSIARHKLTPTVLAIRQILRGNTIIASGSRDVRDPRGEAWSREHFAAKVTARVREQNLLGPPSNSCCSM